MKAHRNFSLMLPWDAARKPRETDIRQDLLAVPLQFGPIAILDNMIIDNLAFFQVMEDIRFRYLMEQYIEAGMLVLWHRPFAPDGVPIESATDLLRIWLSRTTPDAARTVRFEALRSAKNQALQEWLIDCGKLGLNFDRMIDQFFDEFAPPGLQEAIDRCQALFFDEKYPHARFSEEAPPTKLDHLQVRMLEGLGIKSRNSIDWNADATGIAEQLLLNQQFRFLSDTESELLTNHASYSEEFLKVMLSTSHQDVGRMDLRNSVEVIGKQSSNEALQVVSKKLAALVDAIYARGYPERYGIKVIHAPSADVDEFKKARSQAVGASIGEQWEIADKITNLIGKDEQGIKTEARALLWEKRKNPVELEKAMKKHFAKWEKAVLGEHHALFSRSMEKKLLAGVEGKLIGTSALAGVLGIADALNGTHYFANTVNMALGTSILMTGAAVTAIVARNRVCRQSFNIGYSKENATSYKEYVAEVRIA